jgi:hypothetical protein
VEAVITGDVAMLESLLRDNPELVRCVSPILTRLCIVPRFHYVAANGVEGYRQKTPNDTVEIAKALLKAAAEVEALADMYDYTTMSMLVSSCHPAKVGVQVRSYSSRRCWISAQPSKRMACLSGDRR